MRKITIGVCKVFKNGRRFSKHRKNTNPAWKHYFVIEHEPNVIEFYTEWVNSITAQFLKLKKWHWRKFICEECRQVFQGLVKNDRMKIKCPYCPDEED